MIFSKLFYCSSRRQQKLSKNVVFLFSVLHCHGVFPSGDQQEDEVAKIHSSSKRKSGQSHHFLWVSEVTLGIFGVQFWGFSVLQLVLQRHGVFPPAGDFFEAVLLQQLQATEVVEKGCFSRISDATLGTFLAWFWN